MRGRAGRGRWRSAGRCAMLPETYDSLRGAIMPERVKDGDTVRVHYRGRLENGDVFDESAGGEPLEFRLGEQQVIGGLWAGGSRVGVGVRQNGPIYTRAGHRRRA